MLGYSTPERLAAVEVPVLLARGRRDLVCTAAFLDDLAAAAPGAERLVVRKGGHLAQVNGAARLADAVLHLASRGRAGRA